MDRYMLFPSGMGQHQNGSYVLFADAQATITALQDERDGWVRSREHYYQLWMRATDERDEMRKERDEFESLLTQRTAELNEIEKIVDIDSGKTLIEKVRDLKHSFKQVYDSYQDAANEMFKAQDERTAELEAVSNFIGVKYDAESKTWVSGQAPYLSAGTTKQEACIAAVDALRLACATWETKYRDLQAELERVRGELVEATHNANVYQSLYSTGCMDRALLENELRDIRTLLLALPKVEGEIVAKAGYLKDKDRVYALFASDEVMNAHLALWEHRQGMEG